MKNRNSSRGAYWKLMRTIAAGAVFLSCFGSVFAAAQASEAVVSTDIESNKVKVVVSGTFTNAAADEPVSFDLYNDKETACVRQSVTDSDGKYRFAFFVNPKFSGKFTYSVKAWNEDAQTGTVEIADVEKLAGLISGLSGISSAQEMENRIKQIEPGVNMTVYNKLKTSEWSDILYNEIHRGNVPDSADALYRIIKQCVVLAAVNKNADEIFSDGKMQYINILGIDEESAGAYESELSKSGVAAVNSNITKKKYRLIGDCAKEFRSLVLTNRITNNSSGDLSVAQSFLIKNGEELGLLLSKSAGRETEVARAIVNASPQTAEELINEYNKICSSLPAETVSGGNGGGGSGGSGGGIPNKVSSPDSSQKGSYIPFVEPSKNETIVIRSGFSDMENYSWAEEAVANLKNLGAINGKTETTFAPSDLVKREEFVKMLINALGFMDGDAENETEIKNVFLDVSSSDWYAPLVSKAVSLGIVTGVSEDKFGVGMLISRQDMAAMSFRALRYFYDEFDTDNLIENFTDFNDIGEYARIPVQILAKEQIINGYGDGSFRPKQTANRAEAAQMIYRMLSYK